jgi:chromosome segregation and condensation protein ScpB
MNEDDPADVLPELKEIIGAILFAARHPMTPGQIRALLERTAEVHGGPTRDFAAAAEPEIAAAIEALIVDLDRQRWGVRIIEVAGGFRMENLPRCGPWLRQ